MSEHQERLSRPDYRAAVWKMHSLSEKAFEDVDNAIRDLPGDEQRHLIEAWFGGDFFEFYADWIAEGDE